MSLVDSRRHQMFPVLDGAQIETAKRFASGEPRHFAPGEVVFDVGERAAPAWLVLEGSIEVTGGDGLDQRGGDHHPWRRPDHRRAQPARRPRRARHRPRRAAGLHRAAVRCRPSARAVVGSAEVGEIVMRAFILRRVGLIQEGGAGSVLVGRPGAPDLVRLQGFLARNGYPYTVLDAAADEAGRAVVERFGVQPEELPLMVCPNGTVLKRPTDAEAGICLGITPDLDPADRLRRGRGRRRPGRARHRGLRRLRGPLGAGARPARVRRPGGRLGADRELPGLPDRHLRQGAGRPRLQPGAEVRRRDRDPARGRAARLRRRRAAARRSAAPELTDGRAVRARTVVVASGARYRRPDIPNLADFEGAGVSYWASPVEAKLCEGEEVALVGGGNSAGQAVVFLAPKVKRLHLVVRGTRARGLDVALPDRPHPGAAERRAARRHRDRGARGRPGRRPRRGGVPRARQRGDLHGCALRHLFLFIGADPNAAWLQRPCRGRPQGLRPHRPRLPGRRERGAAAPRCRSRPAFPASSRSATCARARPSASPRRSARAPPSSRRSTPCWRCSKSMPDRSLAKPPRGSTRDAPGPRRSSLRSTSAWRSAAGRACASIAPASPSWAPSCSMRRARSMARGRCRRSISRP